MLNKIIRFFRPTPSVASITSAFTKQVHALEALGADKQNEVLACDAQIEALKTRSTVAATEALKARSIADRIIRLIEV